MAERDYRLTARFYFALSDRDYYLSCLQHALSQPDCKSVTDAMARADSRVAKRDADHNAYLGARASGCTERDAIAAALT